MDFTLPEELRLLQRTLREFVNNEMIPLEPELGDFDPDDMPASFIKPIQEKIKAAGLWAMSVPNEYGGGGLNSLGTVVVATEQCRSTFRKRIYGEVDTVLYHSSDYIKENYLLPTVRGEKISSHGLSEPNAGGDLAGLETYFEQDADNYIINGTKIWQGRAPECDYMLVLARRKGTRRRDGLAWFVVDKGTPGFEVTRVIRMMGLHNTSESHFTNCVVPAANRVTPEGDASWVEAQKDLNSNRISIGAECLGMAMRCQEMTIPYAKQRVTFGEPLSNRQAVQFMLADSEIDMLATQWMLYHVAWKADQREDIRHEASAIKVFATEMAERVIDRAIQIHGAMGYSKDLPLEKFYRNIRAYRIFEGPTEIHRWVVARNLLRHSLGVHRLGVK